MVQKKSWVNKLFFFFLILGSSGVQSQEINVQHDIINALTHFEEGEFRPYGTIFTTKKLDHVNTDTHTELLFKFKSHQLEVLLNYDDTALNDPKLLLVDADLFSFLRNSGLTELKGIENSREGLVDALGPVSSTPGMSELFFNAAQGNLSAQTRVLRWRLSVLSQMSVSDEFENQFPGTRRYLQDLKSEYSQKLVRLKEEAENAEMAARTRYESRDRDVSGNLLGEMILNNDRAGVAKYLEKILPWELMQKSEENSWKLWLEAIKHPDPHNSHVLFRGMSAREVGLKKETELGAQRAFFSPMLNRQLDQLEEKIRGIVEKREEFGDRERAMIRENDPEWVVRISDMMKSHSEADRTLSPFVSTTPDLWLAESFVSGGPRFEGQAGKLLAIRVDKRRAVANFSTGYSKEFEVLVPLFVFPDEVLSYVEDYDASEESHQAFVEAIGIDWEAAIERNFYDGKFYQLGFDFLQNIEKN